MDIQYCDRCETRLKEEDVEAGRCRRAGERIWCPACTHDIERALADSVRAQVVAEPPARKAPPGVEPVSGKEAPPPRKRGRGKR